jgi:hypothetical protein
MDFIRTLLEQQPLMALFLTIAIGYTVGEMSLKGFSLGVRAVLFVALGVGWSAPRSSPAVVRRPSRRFSKAHKSLRVDAIPCPPDSSGGSRLNPRSGVALPASPVRID